MSPKLSRKIGIDLGGTTISFIDMYSPEKILGEKQLQTPTTQNEIIKALIETVKGMVADHDDELPIGVGLGIAGCVGHANKSIIFSPNLPFKVEYPLGLELEKAINLPVAVENDANAAAIGEKVFGGARELDDFISITLGTGIGSGIFVDGRILHGRDGAGGEAGHIVLDPNGRICSCGGQGCLETISSGTGIARMVVEQYGQKKSAKEVCMDALAGDERAKAILKEAGEKLGDGLITLVNLFNPSAIFFTGCLANAPSDYFDPAFIKVKEKSFGGLGKDVKLEISRLKENIGVFGAAALCEII